MRKALSVLLILISVVILTSCNTMSGLGKDVEAAGDTIEDSAEKNKSY